MESIPQESEAATNSWLICIKGIPIPAAQDKPAAKTERLRPKFNQQEKDNFFKLIEKAMSEGINTTNDIWAHFEVMEEETGEKVFLRGKQGQLMSWHTLNDYVLLIKRSSNKGTMARPLKSDMVVDLYKQGKSESEIREIAQCSKKHVYMSLVIAGLKKCTAKWFLDYILNRCDMTQQVQDLFDDEAEFGELVESARMNAANDWEEKFVAGIADKFKEFGSQMYLSDLQLEHLNRIAGDE
ncbi:MAG: hypothetical protein KBC53_07175 [Nitrosomonas sp.]|nr:hypothetical protein [Nitrosomonas sp.]